MRVSWSDLFLGCFCLGLFIFLPGRRVEAYLAQARTTEFVPLDATVTRSEVYSYRARRGGTRYAWSIFYSIDTPVGPIASDRQSFTSNARGSESSMRDLVDEHPVGSTITVYAHPDDVSISVLRRGLSFGELLHAGLSGTVLAGGLCWGFAGIASLFSRSKPIIAGGAYIETTPSTSAVSTEDLSPRSYAATFFCIALILAVPISGLLGGRGLIGTAAVGCAMLLLLLVASYRIYLNRLRARRSDRYLLVFDHAGSRVILPRRSYSPKDPIPAGRVTGFEITEEQQRKAGTKYTVSMLYRDRREKERASIRTFWNKDQAEGLLRWCEEQLARCT